MEKEPIMVKHDKEQKQTRVSGKLYRLMVKSEKMEAIISELDPYSESRWYEHNGEEIHLMLHGEMDYIIEDKTYHLTTGDVLWHPSDVKHKAKNLSGEKISYITIGAPPTFM
ncbi:MAG: cupin domain-containing protein [Thermoplasmatota archaeon]